MIKFKNEYGESIVDMKNIIIDNKGRIKGWKTLKGMIYQLNLVNKRFKKFEIKGDFTIKLPLK